ncbi:2-dehydro-3-deoxygalactonokinase [Shewanella youngdeokensis]|uniref:2-dehydro-3-deoxygalactonokinase n=1 Tax=Shewanella youngdeokensis TaxID=2999068 RepID=A0ABZ0JXL5_9GAMM|nr:2-dehydro-3-deoxygalactonokinase [Shewanella sp. DAU334]
MSVATHFIAIDWGTSHLRAYLCLVSAYQPVQVIERVNNFGVKKIQSDFKTTLLESITPWIEQHGVLDILMIGQIGSSIGWKETQYLPCPVAPSSVISAGVNFVCNGNPITIFPGLSCQTLNGLFDAMRGEEMQLLGWLNLNPLHQQGRHLICMPGTHTKWVLIENGIVQVFKTALTGELYDLLSNHSVLIQQTTSKAEFDFDAFNQGAQFIIDSDIDNFSHGLFSVRSEQLFGDTSAKQAHCYLSGLLIAHDVKAALQAKEWDLSTLPPVTIIGSNHLSQCFAKVLNYCQISTKLSSAYEATLTGFEVVYRTLNPSTTAPLATPYKAKT